MSEEYKVEFKAFKTGQWYTKTITAHKPAAFSVARIGNYGRACRIIEVSTGKVLFESPEEEAFKAVNGDVSKFS